MRLSNPELEQLLPIWMREDAYDVAMARVIDGVVAQWWDESRLLTRWDKIDLLPEPELDRLAVELHVDWYDSGATIEAKREAIKTSDLIHARQGTVDAVERLIGIYFGNGRVVEWFDYEGDPHHFKAYTGDPTAVSQNINRFAHYLGQVKRHSSKLDSIVVELQGTARSKTGAALTDSECISAVLNVEGMRGTAHVPTTFAVVIRDRIVIRMHAGLED